MAVHLYADWTRPDDTLDGSQPTVSGGAGPKKHLNAAKALIPNPVEDEYFIHVAGDTANPDNYVYIDGTDDVIDFSDLDMTHPAARITIMPTSRRSRLTDSTMPHTTAARRRPMAGRRGTWRGQNPSPCPR